ncbi:hypothetical protein SH591_08760 [Sphingomonas sp. LY54]|uniref:hypothetical protein n=1 Tax=Sphingomonas sp. LY54 TaxID=3095343 RepID=UPI002D786C82|nr:hypothetical protein [Sphingomonas sp. LY54]WRP27214.1 hypothetical protein SH591_08760 [Sphingomonas sp. LY54]
MATKAHQDTPLDALLAAIPSLPRPVLARLVARSIERMDEMDGDPDLEDDDPAGGNVLDEPHDQEADDEREQMLNDVPCLPVYAIEPDLETGERRFLGMSNLSPNFVAATMPASA